MLVIYSDAKKDFPKVICGRLNLGHYLHNPRVVVEGVLVKLKGWMKSEEEVVLLQLRSENGICGDAIIWLPNTPRIQSRNFVFLHKIADPCAEEDEIKENELLRAGLVALGWTPPKAT